MKLAQSMIALRFLFGLFLCVSAQKFPRITTYSGIIEGHYKVTARNKTYEAYEGIPYAEIPDGYLRFEPPHGKRSWHEGRSVLIAKELGFECMQYDDKKHRVRGREDCLHLNLYIPKESPKSPYPLPIIFYIHGDDFQTGSGGEFGAKHLLDRKIILVTFNYRLGPLGFLATEDDVIPGNMGLMDQVLALRWVNTNAKTFGGDRKKITIVGHGAGGASVHYHYLSKQTDGLFRKGMSLSGTALAPWAHSDHSLEKTKLLAVLLFCPTKDNLAMVNCLKGQPADDIVLAANSFRLWTKSPFAPFGPVSEKWVTDHTFITRSPYDALTSGQVHNLPWITGVVAAEGLAVIGGIVANHEQLHQMNTIYEWIAPHLFGFNYTVPHWKHPRLARWIKDYYLGDYPIASWTTHPVSEMIGDRLFVGNAVQAALLQAQAGFGPIRFYKFSYRGAHSYTEAESNSTKRFGVAHKDDLAYLIESHVDSSSFVGDHLMRQKMLDLWVSYATADKGQPKVITDWPALTKDSKVIKYLNIRRPNVMEVENSTDLGEREFWGSLGIQEDPLYHKYYKPDWTDRQKFLYKNHIRPCNTSSTVFFFH